MLRSSKPASPKLEVQLHPPPSESPSLAHLTGYDGLSGLLH